MLLPDDKLRRISKKSDFVDETLGKVFSGFSTLKFENISLSLSSVSAVFPNGLLLSIPCNTSVFFNKLIPSLSLSDAWGSGSSFIYAVVFEASGVSRFSDCNLSATTIGDWLTVEPDALLTDSFSLGDSWFSVLCSISIEGLLTKVKSIQEFLIASRPLLVDGLRLTGPLARFWKH